MPAEIVSRCDSRYGRIVDQRGAVVGGFGGRAERPQLALPLAEPQEQAQGKRADQQPRRDDRIAGGGERAGGRPQDESDGDRHHVQNHLVLEEGVVGQHEAHIDNADHQYTPVGDRAVACKAADDQAGGQQADGQYHRGAHADTAGSDRAVAFLRMEAVLFAVEDVVEGVNAAAQQAESDERQTDARHRRRIAHLHPEDKGRKDEDVLDPLMRASQFQKVRQRMTAGRRGVLVRLRCMRL